MATKVKINGGIFYNKRISGVFDLAGNFKSGVSDKCDGCIWILRDGKKSRVHVDVDNFEIMDKGASAKVDAAPVLVDENILAKTIEQRFTVMETLIDGVINKSIKSLIISGAPGIGKTYTVDKKLREATEKRGLNVSQLTGSATAIGLYLTLYDHRNSGDILVLDDLDSIFQDQEALNLLKGALDTGRTRTISWMSASKYLRENDIPNSFEFEGTVIFISNLDFDGQIERGSKLSPHLSALVNRCVYLDLGIHGNREVMIRIKQVIKNTSLLQDLGLTKDYTDSIISWMDKHANDLRSLSIRTIIQLANFVRTNPLMWETIAETVMIRK
jgi:hypothetical protein